MVFKIKSYIDDTGRECTKCGEYKTWKHFAKSKPAKTGRQSKCKQCHNKQRNKKPELLRRNNFKNQYGITLEMYNEMLEAQHYGCKICGKDKETNGRHLAVDHCHTTGQIRGLLCIHCNLALGYLNDDKNRMRLALQYLEDATAE